MLDAREDDGYLASFTLVIGPDPGDWRPIGWPATPAFDPDPWVGYLEPFLIESPSQFRSHGPNALTSGLYAKEFNEVKELGALNSSTRTEDQTRAAVFWQFAPIALWNPLAAGPRRPLRARHSRPGSPLRDGQPRRSRRCDQLLERQVLLELLAAAGGDPGGRHRREPEDDRRPELGVVVRRRRHRRRRRSPRRRSPTTLGSRLLERRRPRRRWPTSSAPTRSRSRRLGPLPERRADPAAQFERFSDALEEVIDARVWGGIHFRTADVQGAVIGKKVAHWLAQALLPARQVTGETRGAAPTAGPSQSPLALSCNEPGTASSTAVTPWFTLPPAVLFTHLLEVMSRHGADGSDWSTM